MEKDNCLELQLTIMSLRVLQTMIMNLFTKLKIFVWAISIFLISGLVQYLFIKTYNIYNPHWIDWAQEEHAVVEETFTKLTFPSLEENKYGLYVGNFIVRDKLGIVVCMYNLFSNSNVCFKG